MARKVFNSPAYVKPCVVDVAHKLLGKDNWVFLDGKAHVEFRKGLNGLFTRQALSIYMPRLDDVYQKYFDSFVQKSAANNYEPIPWMPDFREMMCALSCRTFVGHYMNDAAVKKVADDYYLITAALELVNFPIILPFTKTWYGKRASDMVLEEFSKCAAKSKVRMAAGGEVSCIMDAWVNEMLKSAAYREKLAKGIEVDQSEKPTHLLRDFTDYEIAQTIFTFLFASQDATSSACTWLFQLMADRPEILDKVREENLRARNGEWQGHHGASRPTPLHPRRRQGDTPIPTPRDHGPVRGQEGLPRDSRIHSPQGIHDHSVRLAVHARSRCLCQPRDFRSGPLGHR
jgi:C-22 sterol desaturase